MCKKVDYIIYNIISIYVHIKMFSEVITSYNKGFVQLLRLQSNLHSITPLFAPSLLSSKIIQLFLE